MTLSAYEALRDKVDGFAAGVRARRDADLSCRRGCAGCCHVELSVSAVEAAAITAHLATLDPAARAALARRAAAKRHPLTQPLPEGEGSGRCVMLGDDDACGIYAARPLVCRTQGLPLGYPAELIPAASVRVRAGKTAVACCPLNFTERAPDAADVLDAERVNQMLALVNQSYVEENGGDPLRRVSLRALARGARRRSAG